MISIDIFENGKPVIPLKNKKKVVDFAFDQFEMKSKGF